MPNIITPFKKYTSLLDEVYQNASVTSMLDMNGATVRMGTNANEIVIPKISMDGLGDYSRNSGYAQGSVTLTHETVKFNYDRGRRFTVDAMDDEETAGVAFGQLSGEFIRTSRPVRRGSRACGPDRQPEQDGRGRGAHHRTVSVHHPHAVQPGAEHRHHQEQGRDGQLRRRDQGAPEPVLYRHRP